MNKMSGYTQIPNVTYIERKEKDKKAVELIKNNVKSMLSKTSKIDEHEDLILAKVRPHTANDSCLARFMSWLDAHESTISTDSSGFELIFDSCRLGTADDYFNVMQILNWQKIEIEEGYYTGTKFKFRVWKSDLILRLSVILV